MKSSTDSADSTLLTRREALARLDIEHFAR